ncbi:hypothetical protein C8Q73DRAFT_794515 [Cubamyces lactineus]|nr:hypothetical protein C8Q73DRAFT_794515 [Cubamyces lactineus]
MPVTSSNSTMDSMDSFSVPPEVPSLETRFGAFLLATFMGLMLYGLTLHQSYRYFRLFSADIRLLKAIVLLTVITETTHILLCTHICYFYLVTNFFNPTVLLKGVWSFQVLPIATTLVISLSQGFFTLELRIHSRASHKRGKGLIAARTISRGELVLAEAPLVRQNSPLSNDTVLSALSTLSEIQQREYFSLANAWKGTPQVPPPLGIFKTNAFPCGDHDDLVVGTLAEGGAVFALGSRFNLSCSPNVNNYWNDQLGKVTFWAVRDIVEGEELTICYMNPLAPRAARQSRLKARFKFDCACSACSLSGEAAGESDERRSTIARLYEEVGRCGHIPATGLRKVKQALKLLEEEGLDVMASSFYYDGFQFCASVHDAKNAKAWAKKAWESYCATRGPDSTDAKKTQKYQNNPRAHAAFGLLGRQKLSSPDSD